MPYVTITKTYLSCWLPSPLARYPHPSPTATGLRVHLLLYAAVACDMTTREASNLTERKFKQVTFTALPTALSSYTFSMATNPKRKSSVSCGGGWGFVFVTTSWVLCQTDSSVYRGSYFCVKNDTSCSEFSEVLFYFGLYSFQNES